MRTAFGVLATILLACAGVRAESPDAAEGQVEQVQLIDASEHGGRSFLLLTLDGGQHFELPGADHLAAGEGARVEVEFLAARDDDRVPVACRVTVLAVPLEVDGKVVVQSARNPFTVYTNNRSACRAAGE